MPHTGRVALRALLALMFTLLMSGAPPAYGDSIPTAAEVLRRAEQGRIELLQVTSDVERFAPMLSTREDLYSYIVILDELDKLRAAQDIDAFGSNPVRRLARVLTKEALRWIRFDVDGWEFLDEYLRWAPSETAYAALTAQTYHLTLVEDLDNLLRWNDVIGRATELVRSLRDEPYVIGAYQEFQGAIVGRILRADGVTEDTALQVINAASSPQALSEIVLVLEQMAYDADTPVAALAALDRALALKAAVDRLPNVTSLTLQAAPGLIALEALQRVLDGGGSPSVELADPIIEALRPRQQAELLLVLTQLSVTGFERNQVDFLWALIGRLHGRYESLNMDRELQELRRIAGRVRILMLGSSGGYEGTYAAKVGSEDATITIVNVDESAFIIGLGIPRGISGGTMVMDYSFQHVVYDFLADQFVGTRFDMTDLTSNIEGAGINYTLKFRLANGKISGVFYGDRGLRRVEARLVDSYERYLARPEVASRENITGTYYGRGELGGNFTVAITQNERRASGNILMFNGVRITTPLSLGYFDQANNVVYLTSGDDTGRWLHLRGQVRGGVFEGFYVVGGSGRRFGKIRMGRG